MNRVRGRLARRLSVAGVVAGVSSLALYGAPSAGPVRAGLEASGGQVPDVIVAARSEPAGRPIARGFVGLSLEYDAVPAYAGTDPHAINPLLAKLLDNLAPAGGLVLRIGGDSADLTGVPVKGLRPPPEVRYTLTPKWFATMRALAGMTDAHLILDVNLKAQNKRLETAEAHALITGVGRDRVDALEIGNEPEYYPGSFHLSPNRKLVRDRPPGWGLAAYTRESARLAGEFPSIPMAGPATGKVSWLEQMRTLIAAEPMLRQITFHLYPLDACTTDPQMPLYPSIDHLLKASSSRGLAKGTSKAIALAHKDGLLFRVDELNGVACGGRTGVSNTFASSLWMLDTLFALAHAGVDGVNIHMRPGAFASQLFTLSGSGDHTLASVRPQYYSVLLFNEAAPAGSRLVPVQQSGGGATVSTWATSAPDGRHRIVMINDSRTRSHQVIVRVPVASRACSLERLTAPGISATAGVTLGGRTFGAETGRGVLSAGAVTKLSASIGECGFRLPASSAALITY